ncbi:MAG: hypothetical protein ABIJ37_01275 [Pseudomonadota bacterium]
MLYFGTFVFLVLAVIAGTNISANDDRINLLEKKVELLQEKVAVLEKKQISQKDIAALEKLTIEFADELALLNMKVSKLEDKFTETAINYYPETEFLYLDLSF